MERKGSDVEVEKKTRRKPAGAAVLQDSVTTAIYRALFEEWAETGYSALHMKNIAARAGVGKAALYRRSKSKFELVTEAVAATATSITPIPDTGSFAGDVTALIRKLAVTLRHPLVRRILPDLHAENARSDELNDLLERVTLDRRTQANVMIDRAIAREELPEATDRGLILDMLIAPLYWRVIVQRRTATSEDINRFSNIVRAFAEQENASA
ncbi:MULTISPECIES: TetR/AcrR family transcriptional regulator [Alphaproteobacteria]|uniref:TetR/AcrR family transcriptional regulator n=1 Tax=Alphaproteobacteria TaxID=28211 RepID=UPI002491475B|nr:MULTISPECIES: TetR/AcrR family transcriptional regulator [Alphaproteobacteria]